ncbi:class I SAM-dependent methyltransferase [Candidatus Uhrbacteria bacterium]|nr:class I SAM-dependent methyltransferase [Candidatus Uhrbacteria bacterium]
MNRETAEKICALNARTYDRIARAFSDTRARPWDECAPLSGYVKNEMNVLDVGCGNGRLLISFPQDLQIQYTGIDTSIELIQRAQELYANDPRQPEFFTRDVLSLQTIPEIQSRQYDVVSAIAVLHHIPSREFQTQVLFLMREFLKPGGMLFLTNWNLLQIDARKSVWRHAWERWRMSDGEWQKKYGFSRKELGFRDGMTTWKSGSLSEPLYYYSFTLGELARLCQSAGFCVREVYYSKKGMRAHWWDGRNSVVVAQRV